MRPVSSRGLVEVAPRYSSTIMSDSRPRRIQGPWLVPFVDESQIADIKLETRVNGEVRQSDRTSRMIFSFRKIINYISTFTTLVAGDVIVCGTPTGAGARFDPPIWLKPGDVVEVEADGLGILRNTIVDEA